jgi:ABC-type lipoprotein export system ATPase subunit
MIELHNIIKTFKNAAGEFTVLKGINLTLGTGEFVAIVGKSGSGKSTLLNMITGIDHPSTGQVIINGTNIYSLTESQRSLWRGRNLGIVFQFFQLLPMLSLLENVMLPMDYANLYDFDERPKRALRLLAMVGLEEQAYKLPIAVSTGQQQSAAIARALATDPPLIVADEPTGNLDSRSAENIINLFDHLTAEGKTIAMVTHDPSLTERTSRTVIISDGELVDETVARALPLLSHRQMLAVTKKAERLTFQPGTSLLQPGQPADYFYMIAQGNVEIKITDKKNSKTVRLNPGEFFGDAELMGLHKQVTSVQASLEAPVELLALHHSEFLPLLQSSPLTQEALARIVEKRIENQVIRD